MEQDQTTHNEEEELDHPNLVVGKSSSPLDEGKESTAIKPLYHDEIIQFYSMNGYLLLVEYLLYIEQEQEREEIKKTSLTSTLNFLETSNKQPSEEHYKNIQAADTIEDLLIRIDLKRERNYLPKFLEDFERNCLFGGFEWFHHSFQSLSSSMNNNNNMNRVMDPITSIFCRNPSKEAFLMFIQGRIHQHSYTTSDGSFSKRLDVDSVRDLRNKFIEKTFLKITSSSSMEGGRVNFPSSLKTREKKTDFLLQVCNLTIENDLKDENMANYSEKFFGSFLKCSLTSSRVVEKLTLPLSIQETTVEKDIAIAQRIIGACYRNVLILYFIQIIFASGVSSISSQQQQQAENSDSSSSSIFHFSKEYNILMKQILYVTSLMNVIVREYEKTDQSNTNYSNYRNIALRNIVLEIYEQQERQHETKVRLPLEKLFHQLVHESLMESYLYLCKQVKRQMELHGYGSSGVEILTRDVLWWIFKVFNSIKVMEKNEKEKISKEQERIELSQKFTKTPNLTDQKRLKLVELISQTEPLKNVGEILDNQKLVTFYSSPEFEEDFPFDQILSNYEENKKKSKMSFL